MIEVRTTVHAPLSKVCLCWTDASHIIHWNFASDDWTCPKASNPLEAGATFNWRMEAKDQSMGFDFKEATQKSRKKPLLPMSWKMGDR